MTPAVPASATIYSGALSPPSHHCATFALIAPPSFPGRWPYTVMSGARALRRGSLTAQQTVTITVPLLAHASARGTTATITVRVRGQVLFFGGLVSARLANFGVVTCSRSKASV